MKTVENNPVSLKLQSVLTLQVLSFERKVEFQKIKETIRTPVNSKLQQRWVETSWFSLILNMIKKTPLENKTI